MSRNRMVSAQNLFGTLAFFILSACGADSSLSTEASPCPNASTWCSTQCVDLQTDPSNCGVCENSCGNALTCTLGTCNTICGGGSVRCGASCVDLQNDVNNCGSCGQACKGNDHCAKGQCGSECGPDAIQCGSSCVNWKVDVKNCGSCGTICENGSLCVDGNCESACGGGSSMCGDTCKDLSYDPHNCGTCGKVCSLGSSCDEGICAPICSTGFSTCANECTDLITDWQHCGECDHPCPAEHTCDQGHCSPPLKPSLLCNNAFTGVYTDRAEKLLVRDLNGDNQLDFVVKAWGNRIRVILGNSLSAPHQDLLLSGVPLDLVPVDLNRDGYPDLAVSYYENPPRVEILVNDGKGFFVSGGSFAVGPTLQPPYPNRSPQLAFGDLNGDMADDLVVTVSYEPQLRTILSGSTPLSFGTTIDGPDLYYSKAFVVDMNGDGKLDICYRQVAGLKCLLNDGSGSFPQSVLTTLPYNNDAGLSKLSDVDNDGKLDLITVDSEKLKVYRQAPVADLTPIWSYKLEDLPMSVLAKDLNGDNREDLIVSVGEHTFNANSFPHVNVFLHDGKSGFLPPTRYEQGYILEVVATDLDGDTKPEILINSSEDALQVLQNRGDGRFLTDTLVKRFDLPVKDMKLADFNNDGWLDIAFTGYKFFVMLSDGQGDFSQPVTYDFGYNKGEVALGDFNNDGILDVLTGAEEFGALLWIGKGDGSFVTPDSAAVPPPVTNSSFTNMIPADYNNDGYLDFAAARWLHFNKGNATFKASPKLNWILAGGDLNNDSFSDLVTAQEILINDGTGSFSSVPMDFHSAGLAIVADVNGDGLVDIVVGHGHLEVFLAQGNGTFLPGIVSGQPNKPSQLGFFGSTEYVEPLQLAPLHGTSALDVYQRDPQSNSLIYAKNMGGGHFGDTQLLGTIQRRTVTATGDIDRDGSLDLVVLGTYGLEVRYGHCSN